MLNESTLWLSFSNYIHRDTDHIVCTRTTLSISDTEGRKINAIGFFCIFFFSFFPSFFVLQFSSILNVCHCLVVCVCRCRWNTQLFHSLSQKPKNNENGLNDSRATHYRDAQQLTEWWWTLNCWTNKKFNSNCVRATESKINTKRNHSHNIRMHTQGTNGRTQPPLPHRCRCVDAAIRCGPSYADDSVWWLCDDDGNRWRYIECVVLVECVSECGCFVSFVDFCANSLSLFMLLLVRLHVCVFASSSGEHTHTD